MKSEKTLRDEVRLVRQELKQRLKEKNYLEVLRLVDYLDCLEFILSPEE